MDPPNDNENNNSTNQNNTDTTENSDSNKVTVIISPENVTITESSITNAEPSSSQQQQQEEELNPTEQLSSSSTSAQPETKLNSSQQNLNTSRQSLSNKNATPRESEATSDQPQTPAQPTDPAKVELEQYQALFSQIQQEFKRTLSKELSESFLDKFRVEYEKMFQVLSRSKDHILKLSDQYVMYNAEYTGNLASFQNNSKSAVHDQETLKVLKTQIKQASDIIESCSKREEKYKEELKAYRTDILSLQSALKEGVGLSAMQEKVINELMHAKEMAAKDLEVEIERVTVLRNRLLDLTERIRNSDFQKRDIERRIYELRERNARQKAEIEYEARNKEKLEKDLKEIRTSVMSKTQEVRTKQDLIVRTQEETVMLESQIRNQKQNLEKLLRDRELLEEKFGKTREEYNEESKEMRAITEANDQFSKDVKAKEVEYTRIRVEIKKLNKLIEQLQAKVAKLQEQKDQTDKERKDLRKDLEKLQNDILEDKRRTEHSKKVVDDLVKERNLIVLRNTKSMDEGTRATNFAETLKQSRRNIEIDIEQYNKDAQVLLKDIKTVKEERDILIAEAEVLSKEALEITSKIKTKETEIYECRKKIMQAENRLKHQQNLYEAVQNDRTLQAKLLGESQNEIVEMKRKLKVINAQINNYKEDIVSKEESLKKEISLGDKLKKEITTITEDVKNYKHQNELAISYNRAQLSEEAKLNQFVKEADLERARQDNALKVLMSEREHLGAQLIKQNEELAKVYEKLKTNQFELTRGGNRYAERVKQIRELRQEIRDLKMKKFDLESDQLPDLKLLATRLEAELVEEKSRLRALQEELKFPMNVHRWRKLESSDPKTYELLQLLHSLQKRLIAKTEEEQRKAAVIQAKEEQYLQLKNILVRQVGPEAIEQINEFERILKDKNKQYKHMGTELNMYQAQVKEYRYQIQNLDKAFQDLKSKFRQQYHQKMRQGTNTSSMFLDHQRGPKTESSMPPPSESDMSEKAQSLAAEMDDIRSRLESHGESVIQEVEMDHKNIVNIEQKVDGFDAGLPQLPKAPSAPVLNV